MATPPVPSPSVPKPDLSALRISDNQRGRARGRRAWIWVAAAILVAGLAGSAAFALRGRPTVVDVATAAPPATGPAGVLNASGYVTPRRRATIAAKITGRVTAVFFDEGTRVKEGQLLATLDDTEARRALDSARADRDSARAGIEDYEVQLRNADIELRRAQQLVKERIQTQQALDGAVAAADSLRAKIKLATQQVAGYEARIREQQQAVNNCTIRAPFAGIVVSKDAQVGEMVSPVSAGGGFTRTGIATIVDLHSNEFEVDVSEAYIAKVAADQAVNAVLDAYPDWTIPAKVRTVIPTADRQKATVKVRISLTEADHVRLSDPAKDARILPDMGVKVTFLENAAVHKGPATTPALALVPQKALRQDATSKFVFVLNGAVVERRAVTVGAVRGTDVEILGGLQPGAVVVTNGPDTLADGQAVQVSSK
jgi:RND family efflux transporter MFP subunit